MVVEAACENVEKAARFLKGGRITEEEFSFNSLLTLVQVDDDTWRATLSRLDKDTLEVLANYCKNEVDEDFVAPVGIFLPHGCSEQEVIKVREELTKKYRSFAELISQYR